MIGNAIRSAAAALIVLLGVIACPREAEAQIYCPQNTFGTDGSKPTAGQWWVCLNFLQSSVQSTNPLTALPTGDVFIGNISGKPAAQAVSGDATLSAVGALTVTKTNGVPFTAAATTPLGTSGASLCLLSANCTFSGTDNFTGTLEIGGTPVTLPVSVAIGGTGAATASAALSNLGIEDATNQTVILPSGTTGQRPSIPQVGNVRYNTTLGAVEAFVGAAWQQLTGPPGNFYVGWYGALGVSSDDGPAIQNALDAAKAYGVGANVHFDAIQYRVLTADTWDSSYVTIKGNGGAINCTGMSNGPCWNIAQTANTTPISQLNLKTSMQNLDFVGPGKSSTVDLFFFQSPNTGCSPTGCGSLSSFTNVAAKNFRYGVSIGNNSWLMSFTNCAFIDFTSAVYAPSGITNSGENINFTGGVIAQSSEAVTLVSPVVINFDHTSFDFNVRNTNISYGNVNCTDCHFEANVSGITEVWFLVNNFSGSLLYLKGGDIVLDGSGPVTGASCLFEEDGLGETFLDGVRQDNLAVSSNVVACGSGNFIERNSTTKQFSNGYPSTVDLTDNLNKFNLLADGGFEQSALSDLVWIGADTAPIVFRATGTNLSLSVSTDAHCNGSQSLKLVKSGGSGTAATIYVAAPFPKQQLPLAISSYIVLGSLTGSVAVTLEYVQILGVDGNGVPILGARTQIIRGPTTLTLSGAPITCTGMGLSADGDGTTRAPAWATHIAWKIDAASMPAGNIYFDNFVANSL